MLDIPEYKLRDMSTKLGNWYSENSFVSIDYIKYLQKAFSNYAKSFPTKSVTVNIPKSPKQLLEGDFDPLYSFTIEQPLTLDDNVTPLWFGNTMKGILLPIGYENGDSRLPSKIEFCDDSVHGLLGGITGSGKTVCIDAITFGQLLMYPPWELQLTLLDPKIASFYPYASSGFPHIRNVCASPDSDYAFGIYERMYEEINLWNKIYSMVGASKLEEFRKKTGLNVPRNLIIQDELQTLMINAGRKSRDIEDKLALIAKLGRSTGYHLFCVSQEPGDSISKNTLNNMTIRAVLKCNETVSNAILGNDEGRSITTKGVAIINTKPQEKNNRYSNMMFKVPYLSDKYKNYCIKVNQNLVKKVSTKYKYPLNCDINFFDIQAESKEDNFKNYLRQFPLDKNAIYLGEPSYYVDEGIKCCKIEFDNLGGNNILIVGKGNNANRYLITIKYNLELQTDKRIIIFYFDKRVYDECGLSSLGGFATRLKNTESSVFRQAVDEITARSLLCDIDDYAFSNGTIIDEIDEIFKEVKPLIPDMSDDIIKKRLSAMCILFKKPDYKKVGFNSENIKENINFMLLILVVAKQCGCLNEKAEATRFPPKYIFVLGADRIEGMGRGSRTRDTENFKSILDVAPEVNVRFILQITDTQDMNYLRNCTRFKLTDGLDGRSQNALGVSDDYPGVVPNELSLVYDSDEKEFKKFKKLILTGEKLI